MGPAGLTAVFGMGTGVTPPVWSPEKRPAGGQAAPGASFPMVGHTSSSGFTPPFEPSGHARSYSDPYRFGSVRPHSDRSAAFFVRGQRSRSGWSSCLAVRTGRLRRSPAVHVRPIDLVVFQEPTQQAAGNLILEGASRLDAFSAYPVPTWLPGDALSGTAGTPEVGPPQSSRTRGDSPQVSYAHGR